MSLFPRLRAHRTQWHLSLKELFASDPHREKFKLSLSIPEKIHFDFSRTHLNEESLDLFEDLARSVSLSEKIQSFFSGALVNHTENRPALHPALRAPTDLPALIYQGENFRETVQTSLEKMEAFVEKIHQGSISHVIHLGIGGSDLGPRLVCDALKTQHLLGIEVRFVANVDPEELIETLEDLQPETTLFIVASKSFSTQETLMNANLAKAWMQALAPELPLQDHFIAISSNLPKAIEFGIRPEHCFGMSDAIGGRFSLWSSIGLPIALQIGMPAFKALLKGAYAMDQHFQTQPATQNIPVMMALIHLWYRNGWQSQTRAILPYSHRLKLLPAYLQQLEMESLGKSVSNAGTPVPYQTEGVIWGGVGSNGQHAFHQLLHQGTLLIPCDFITIKTLSSPSPFCQNLQADQHVVLNQHAKAQMQALLQGKTLEESFQELSALPESEQKRLAPHKVIPGDRPSLEIQLETLSPETLGALLAAYEHKIFALSVFWDINAFDQFGVELGKTLVSQMQGAP